MSREQGSRNRPAVDSITRARTGLTEEVRGRQRRYLAAMLVRTACVVVMALTWSDWPVLGVGALIGGVLIPYVAVVAAQAGWRQQRGLRVAPAAVTRPVEAEAIRIPLEPTKIFPSERVKSPSGD